MSNYPNNNNYGGQPQWGGGNYAGSVADASIETRTSFIRKTYLHLAAAVLGLIALEFAFFTLVPPATQGNVAGLMMGSRGTWMIVLGLFIGASYVADKMARSESGPPMQYGGLILYTVAEAVILMPLLFIAQRVSPPNTIATAALVTTIIFGALTAFVFITKTDFSWMRGLLAVGTGVAFAVILAGWLFGFSMGLWFIVPMIALAAGYILYQTSALLHQYQPGQHVAASLALFASVVLLFWYVLQLLMRLQRR